VRKLRLIRGGFDTRAARSSKRSFARACHREVGALPAAYVEALRVERARICSRTDPVALGLSPADHRELFKLTV
jgi:hypothetical protein